MCLKQNSVSSLHKNMVNLYITYKLDAWSKDLNTDFTLGNCLFGSVKLTKNDDLVKYKYNSYGIGFDSRLQFSWSDGSVGKNIIIFGVDNISSMHIDGRNKNILVLGDGPTQGLDNATITAKAKYPISFTNSGKQLLLSLHYNDSNSVLFIDAVKIYQLKAKYSEIKPYPLCLDNISKDFIIHNMTKTGLKGSVKVFSVDYNAIDTSDILDISWFLMEEA